MPCSHVDFQSTATTGGNVARPAFVRLTGLLRQDIRFLCSPSPNSLWSVQGGPWNGGRWSNVWVTLSFCYLSAFWNCGWPLSLIPQDSFLHVRRSTGLRLTCTYVCTYVCECACVCAVFVPGWGVSGAWDGSLTYPGVSEEWWIDPQGGSIYVEVQYEIKAFIKACEGEAWVSLETCSTSSLPRTGLMRSVEKGAGKGNHFHPGLEHHPGVTGKQLCWYGTAFLSSETQGVRIYGTNSSISHRGPAKGTRMRSPLQQLLR